MPKSRNTAKSRSTNTVILKELHGFREEVTKELTHLHKQSEDSSNRLRHITDDIRVNGEKGLERILTANYLGLKSLNEKVGPMWEYTEKLRTRFKLARTVKEFIRVRPWLSAMIEGFIGRWFKRLVFAVIGTLMALTFGDSSIHVIEKIFEALSK